ncbi:MAG: hotdog domain-containing protein [Candidatus Caldatribacteriota bacterium]|nr:hotdog domain-containing protein [Candidatus Caldatribacteriota bacterium]
MIEFNLKKGLKGVAQTTVNEENSAKRFTNPMVHVFATPMLVSLMDTAAINAVKKYLPEGYATVASKISITHLAASPIGMSVSSEAILTDIFKNRLTFKVSAFDETEKVGEGTVERYIIDLNNFAKKIMSTKAKKDIGEF